MAAHTPEEIHREFENAFNAGDADALMALYEPEAALIVEPGTVLDSKEAIEGALQWFLGTGGKIVLDTKAAVVVGDLAFLTNRWTLSMTDEDGNPSEMGATTAEVARRQADGTWLYVIDNAIGDAAFAD